MRSIGPLFIVTSMALALSACGKKEEAPAVDAAASDAAAVASAPAAAAPMTGDFAVSDAAGKPLMTTTINPDGTYRDVLPKGLPIAGVWKAKDGKTCFDPSGKDPEECFTTSAPGADGSFTATGADGSVVTVKPVVK
jgi:hypothetical protein